MIRPKIIEQIALYYLDAECNSKVLNELNTYFKKSDLEIKKLKPIAIVLSFINVEIYDRSALLSLILTLKEVEEKHGLIVGLMEYESSQYEELLDATSSINISLFKSFEIAKVFFNVLTPSKETKVVVLDKDLSIAKKIALYLKNRGTNSIGVDSQRDFKAIASKESSRFLIHNTHVEFIDSIIAVSIVNNILTYKLNSEINKKINIYFNRYEFKKYLQESKKVFLFDATMVKSIDIFGVEFFIDILLFARNYEANIILSGFQKGVLDKKLEDKLIKIGVQVIPDMKDMFKNLPGLSERKKIKPDMSKLTKSLVSKVPLIVDSIYDTFTIFSKNKIDKISHKVSICEIDNTDSLFASTIQMSGDINGTISLVFSKPIALEATRMFIGYSSVELDVISDFVEIATTNIKKVLSSNTINIEFDNLVSYDNVDALLHLLGNRGGIFVHLSIDDEPLYIFICGMHK